MAGKYAISPIGPCRHPWIGKADTKYNADGLYHTEIGYEGEVAEGFRKKIDAECEAAHAEHIKDMKPADARKWKVHYPYELEEDPDTGAPTGRIWFKFKQNATIDMEDGTKKHVKMTVRDSQDNPTPTPVFSGDVIRVKYKPRATVASSNKTVGVRLDFAQCQLIKKQERSGGGFGAVDDGFVDPGEDTQGPASEASNDADY